MSNKKIKELQEEINCADPFLVEIYMLKSIEELSDILIGLHKELDVIKRSNNNQWAERHQGIIQMIEAIHELKTLLSDRGDKGFVFTQ